MKLLKRYFMMPLDVRCWLMTTGSMLINVALALYHGFLGFRDDSDILIILSFFYMLLALMRFLLGTSVRRYFKKTPDDFIRGILLLSGMMMIILGLVLSRVIYNMVQENTPTDFGSFSALVFALFTIVKIIMTAYGLGLSRIQKDPIFSLIQRTTLAETLFCSYSLLLSLVPFLNHPALEEQIYSVSGIVIVSVVLIQGIDNVLNHRHYRSRLDELDIPTYEEVNASR